MIDVCDEKLADGTDPRLIAEVLAAFTAAARIAPPESTAEDGADRPQE